MTTEYIERKLREFNQEIELQKLRTRYNTPTFLDVLSVGRSETAHSAAIKWLLEGRDFISDSRESNLMRFFDILVKRSNQQNRKNLDNELRKAIISRDIRFVDIKAECEYSVSRLPTKLQNTDRIDIFITASVEYNQGDHEEKTIKKVTIVIENKIKSQEGKNKTDAKRKKLSEKEEVNTEDVYNTLEQTDRYFFAVYPEAKEAKDKEALDNIKLKVTPEGDCYVFVYLTAIPDVYLDDYEDSDMRASCDKYIHINYQDIADHILVPLIKTGGQSPRVSTFLEEYMNALTIPGVLENEDSNDNNSIENEELLILASSQDDRELLKEFYEKYKELIRPAAYFCAGPKKCNELIDYVADVIQKVNDDELKKIVVLRDDKLKEDINKSGNFKKLVNGIEQLSLIDAFRRQNRAICMAALKILSDADKENRELKLLYDLASNRKIRNKYSIVSETIENKTVEGHGKLVFTVVENFAKEHDSKAVRNKFNKQGIKINKNDKIIYLENEISSEVNNEESSNDPEVGSKRYRHTSIVCKDGIKIWISNQWTPDRVEKFIEIVKGEYKIKKIENY